MYLSSFLAVPISTFPNEMGQSRWTIYMTCCDAQDIFPLLFFRMCDRSCRQIYLRLARSMRENSSMPHASRDKEKSCRRGIWRPVGVDKPVVMLPARTCK